MLVSAAGSIAQMVCSGCRPLAIALVLASTAPVAADDGVTLTIKNHRFEPAEITIPRDTKVRLTVRNEDATAEEFESYELNREKIVPPNGEIVLFIGPLEPGTYPFFGEFHQDTAQGRVIVQ
jgi:plastocyanin